MAFSQQNLQRKFNSPRHSLRILTAVKTIIIHVYIRFLLSILSICLLFIIEFMVSAIVTRLLSVEVSLPNITKASINVLSEAVKIAALSNNFLNSSYVMCFPFILPYPGLGTSFGLYDEKKRCSQKETPFFPVGLRGIVQRLFFAQLFSAPRTDDFHLYNSLTQIIRARSKQTTHAVKERFDTSILDGL